MVTWPRRQISGISQRGSALRARPTFMRNQTTSPSPRGARSGSRSRGAVGSGACSISSSGSGSSARWRRSRAAAMASGVAPGEQRPGGGELVRGQLGRGRELGQKPLLVLGPDLLGRGRRGPGGAQVGGGQELLGPAAARVGDEQHRHALAAGAPGAAAAVHEHLAVCGRSAWMTRPRSGRSSPRAATSVATQTRARPSRSACSAWLRSRWLSSPDSATTEKPRSTRLAARCARRRGSRRTRARRAPRGSAAG